MAISILGISGLWYFGLEYFGLGYFGFEYFVLPPVLKSLFCESNSTAQKWLFQYFWVLFYNVHQKQPFRDSTKWFYSLLSGCCLIVFLDDPFTLLDVSYVLFADKKPRLFLKECSKYGFSHWDGLWIIDFHFTLL